MKIESARTYWPVKEKTVMIANLYDVIASITEKIPPKKR